MHFEVALSAGNLPIMTVADPGAHGAAITGIQGCGVNTPRAAAVAAATWGFDGLMHIPKGMIFTIGLLSMMFAAGMFDALTMLAGRTVRLEGAAPKVHISIAP